MKTIIYKRHVADEIRAALKDTPVVMLVGARQTGKTTLVRHLAEREHPAQYVTFDDLTMRAAARASPQGFLAGFGESVVLDEIQMAPELLPAIKMEVDRDRRPGRFILTGSANVLALPKVSESLAGRMALFALYPLSQGELRGRRESFVDAVFAQRLSVRQLPTMSPVELRETMARGGYPEVQSRTDAERRAQWFRDYANTILQRDIKELAQIEGLLQLPALLSLLATRVGGLLNQAELGRALQIPQTTVKRYLALLECAFLVWRLPTWSANLGKRLVKTPKLYFTDTGLAMHLAGAVDGVRDSVRGLFLENFAIGEIQRQATWSRIRPRLYHFREQTGKEVDLVLEASDGRCVLLEIKRGDAVRPDDLKSLRWTAEQVGSRVVRSILLYTGREMVPFGPETWVVPLQTLWTLAA